MDHSQGQKVFSTIPRISEILNQAIVEDNGGVTDRRRDWKLKKQKTDFPCTLSIFPWQFL